jgi:hypothetical protein
MRSIASTAATAATSEAATTTTGTTTAATATCARLVLGLIDSQRTAAHVLAIETLNGLGCIGLTHFHEPESAWPPGFPIGWQCNRFDGSELRKQRADFRICSRERKISNVYFRHDF